ncbi:MAG: DEAD/DEAH box helicase, partial [Candidatus Pacearchaeota archaeon]
DVIALASTGSGKTLAFASGLIKNIEKNKGIQGLVLVPTRELAEQVTKELKFFSKFKNLNVISIYGGGSINNQIRDIKTAEIIVATPGRLLDHINRQTIDLRNINTLILDEADRMFDMGFRDDVRKILDKCPKKRQTMLFSATFSREIELLSKNYMNHPVEISAEPHVDPLKLTQEYYDLGKGHKLSLLKHLLENETSKLVMIFCNTRKNVDFVSKNLNKLGIESLPIHGGFSQTKRNKVIEKFHSNSVHVLVATDVAARGLHIEGVSHVYNFDIPPTKNEYIHRIGRTARAGKEGKVINLLSARDYDNFRNINDGDFNIVRKEVPVTKKVEIKWMPDRFKGKNKFIRDNNFRKRKNFNKNIKQIRSK